MCRPPRLTRPQPKAGQEHPFRRWRSEHDITLDRVAEFAETTAATISRIESGAQYPRPALLARLVELTSGKVGASDFITWFAAGGAK